MMKQIVTTAQSVYVDVPEAVRLALRLSSAIKRHQASDNVEATACSFRVSRVHAQGVHVDMSHTLGLHVGVVR